MLGAAMQAFIEEVSRQINTITDKVSKFLNIRQMELTTNAEVFKLLSRQLMTKTWQNHVCL